jgi:hypothetical protein
LKKLYLLIIITTIRLAAMAQSYWQQEVHYTIDVSLNDREHSLDGFLKLKYVNHSPDSLSFIWFHLWPNAFKNDQTAFTQQALENDRIDFYFSSREERGYINRLDFRVENSTLKTEDHPQHIDIVKVYLPAALAPGASTIITTPFHVQLPKNFSRGGHVGKSYQVTQWYPKPAVYDRFGWHPMPYLDQGEFYSEFGSFDVRITVPEAYKVAATGVLKSQSEGPVIVNRPSAMKASTTVKKPVPKTRKPSRYAKKPSTIQKPVTIPKKKQATQANQPAEYKTKTLQYVQDKVHDFAWFADTAFEVKEDTIQLDGRIIKAYSYYFSHNSDAWQNSIQYIKDAIRFRSALIGAYPYDVVSVVEAKMGFNGGMEYPTITSLSPAITPKGLFGQSLDVLIQHEIGHNWFQGILASNERDHPWMDEGMNTYYDHRYTALKYPDTAKNGSSLIAEFEVQTIDGLAKIRKDQPATTSSADFTFTNYGLMAYTKTAVIMAQMEAAVGRERFDSCMRVYYEQWKYKHPYPQDFQQLLQSCAGTDLRPYFEALDQKGPVKKYTGRKKLRPALIYNSKDYERIDHINFFPSIGYNNYDKFMIGLGAHNFDFPATNFQYFLAPLYALGSKQLNGIGQLGYTWRTNGKIEKITASILGARFSTRDGADSNSSKVHAGFYKMAPSLRLTFKNRSLRSSLEKWLEWKTYIIGEQDFEYVLSSDGEFYPTKGKWEQRYLNQLSFAINDYRKLYPYDALLQVQQGDGFYRATAEGHYYFNYGTKGGLQMRVFAAKFGYIGEKTLSKQFSTVLYQPKLTAVRGDEDYTYSNYFVGRNEVEGLSAQQIMMRDGGLKLRTDLFQGLQGRSDNWLASMNLNTTLPKGLFPVELPVRIFLDIGTYADAWKKDAATSRFLYVGGLQLSLFKDLLNVYAPILYSKEFRDNLKTVPSANKFGKKISFSIDVHRFSLRKVTGNKIPL